MSTHYLNAELLDLARDLWRQVRTGVVFDQGDPTLFISNKYRGGFDSENRGNGKFSEEFFAALKLGKDLQSFVPSIKKVWLWDASFIGLAFNVDLEKFKSEIKQFSDYGALSNRLLFLDPLADAVYYKRTIEVVKSESELYKIFKIIIELTFRQPDQNKDYFVIPYTDLRREMEKLKLFGSSKNKAYSDKKFKAKITNYISQFKSWSHTLNVDSSFKGNKILSNARGVGIKLFNPKLTL